METCSMNKTKVVKRLCPKQELLCLAKTAFEDKNLISSVKHSVGDILIYVLLDYSDCP